jgi:AcrR family transcriptional regulator
VSATGTSTGATGQRARILDAALDCFSRFGIAATTLDQIRSEAGVSVGGLYHHFRDKLDIAADLYIEGLEAYQLGFLDVIRTETAAEAGIRGGVDYHVRWWTRNRQSASFLEETAAIRALPDLSARLRELNAPFYAEVTAWWRGHAHYAALREIDLDLGYALWLGPASSYCRLWDSGRVGRPGPKQIATLADAAWASVRAE